MWFILISLIAVVIYFKLIKPLNHWKDRGILYQQTPWPLVGNMGPVVFRKKPFFDVVQDFYKAFPSKRYNGIHVFTRPALLVRDVDLVKQITVKYFDYFMNHAFVLSKDVEPLMGKNLFFLQDQDWRDMRSTLSPTFTSSKMRIMFVLLSECAEQFVQHFQKKGSDTITIEVKEMFTKFSNDAIASVAFGLKVDSLEEQDNEFYLMGKEASSFSGLRALKFFILNISPRFAKLLKVKFFPISVGNFFRRVIGETLRKRKEEGLVRPDMIHLLMEAQNGSLKHEENTDTLDTGFATVEESDWGRTEKRQRSELTEEDIVAQALIFFFAGFEQTSTLMSFLAYELAVNPDFQEKLQAEIDETLSKCDGKITYEALLRMKYLDMVVSETLRKWPSGFQSDRICVKDFVIQSVNPDEVSFTVEKGTQIMIPVIGIHRDPKYFPNPDKFDPERFSEENKHKIVPYSYLPFGSGPRSCIASRFALLEAKILAFHLLSKFNCIVVDKTAIPLRLSMKAPVMAADGGLWLGLQLRKH